MTTTTHQIQDMINRRAFLQASGVGIGTVALNALVHDASSAAPLLSHPHHPAKAKRVIYLFQSGGPSQMDLFDPKPGLENERGKELPKDVRGNQRITTMTSKQGGLPVAPTKYRFARHGKSGMRGERNSVLSRTARSSHSRW